MTPSGEDQCEEPREAPHPGRDALTLSRGVAERTQLRRQLTALNQELAQVRRRNRELEQASDELKGFARSLAHDLRQPVIAARFFGFAVENALARNEKERASQYATRIGEATQWIGDYIEALLSLTRISQAALVIEDVDLGELANGLLDELHEQDRGRSILVEVQRDMHARGDPALLRLLLQNLLGNAWKFTSRKDAARVSFSARTAPDGEVVYSVVDNGAGFDMTYAGSLFETFQRFHPSSDFPGTGIGLANARKIVERHGGRIWAQAQPGQGAAFHFTLGAAGGAARPAPNGEKSGRARSGRGHGHRNVASSAGVSIANGWSAGDASAGVVLTDIAVLTPDGHQRPPRATSRP